MTGLYYEPFTQKYHALFRDYDPQHQRWLSEDPAGYVDGMNLYHAYMNVNYIDPKGNFIQFAVLAYLGWVALNTAIDVSLDSLAETYLGDGVMSGEDLAWSAGTNFAINFISFGIGGKLAKAKYLRYLKRAKKGVKESKRAVKGRRAAVIGSTIAADAAMTSMVQGSVGLMRGQDANFTQSFGWGLFGGTVGRSIGLGFSRLMKFRGGGKQPIPYGTPYKQIGKKKLLELNAKLENRTISKNEYKRLMWFKRLNKRREEGIQKFWDNERVLLAQGKKGSYNYSQTQRADILAGGQGGLFSHHKYSVTLYPQIANDPKNIIPATYWEHFHNWHGGAWFRPSHGKPIIPFGE